MLVGGEPGIGKTRLLDELESARAARDRSACCTAGSIEQDRGLPYQEFFEIILEYFRLEGHRQSRRPSTVSDLAPDLVALFPMLGEIPEIRAAAGSGAALERRGAARTPRAARRSSSCSRAR